MKKLLAMMLALVMALSCTGALAQEMEEPMTTTMKISVNQEMLAGIAGAAMTEADQQLLALLMPLLDNLGIRMVDTESGAQYELLLKDVPVATAAGVASESGLVVVSDLFPSYAITMAPETIAQFMAASEIDYTAIMGALGGHITQLVEALVANAGEPQVGEYSLNDIAFNVMTPIEMTEDELALLLLSWVKGLVEDETLAPLFATTESLDPSAIEQAIAALSASAETEGDEAQVNMVIYTIVDAQGQVADDFYLTFEMADEEQMMSLALGAVQRQMYIHLLMGEAIYASMDAMREAALAGGDATVIDIAMALGEADTDIQTAMDIYADGMQIGLFVEYAVTEEGLAELVELYMGGEYPLLVVEALAVPGGEITASLDTEGKTILAMEDLMADEEGTLSAGLMMDVMSYGLNNLIANAAMAMPEEVTALVNTLSAPAEDTTPAIEGVTTQEDNQ